MNKNIIKKSVDVMVKYSLEFFIFVFILLGFSLLSFTSLGSVASAEGRFIFTEHLELGVVGEDVKELQVLLNSKGYNVGTPDGKFGPKTKSQFLLFQKDNNLNPDGIVGQRVRAFLNGVSTTTTTTPTPKLVTETKTTTTADFSPLETLLSLDRSLKLTYPRMGGFDIKALQIFLNSKGYDTGNPDGVFGIRTQAQVKLFQVANNLIPDGSVGPKTKTFIKNTLPNVGIPLASQPTTSSNGLLPSVSQLPAGCMVNALFSVTTGLFCSTGLPPTPVVKIIGGGSSSPQAQVITIPTIAGVAIPAQGEAPISTLADTSQYTATISWVGSPSVFLASNSYTATITITPKSGYTLSGVIANYFTVAGAISTNSAGSGVVTTVFPATPLKQLTISNPTITISKTYDGNTGTVVTAGTLAGVTSGETVTVSAVANYDNKNVGTDKTITVVYTLGGVDAGHYIKPEDYTVTGGAITSAILTINNPTLTTSKEYDGDNSALVTAGSLIGVVNGETITVSAVATYDNLSIGTGKTITVVYTLAGTDAGNYTKPVDYTIATGAIIQKQLTISNPTLTTTKVYNANTTAAVTIGSLSGIIAGENVTVSAVANYDTALPGTNKTITTVYTLGGSQAGNCIKPVDNTNNTGVITAIVVNTSTISGVAIPVVGDIPVMTITESSQFTGSVSWSGGPVTFASLTIYTATITLTAKTGYTLTGVGANFFTVSGATTVTNSPDSGVITAVFPATGQMQATTPSSITLAVGSNSPVGSVTNVAIPVAGGTDTTGVVRGYVATTADKIKFTVVDGGGAASTITINGSAYTSGDDYQILSPSSLTIIVTTTETDKITNIRTFTIPVFISDIYGNVYGTVTGADGRIWLDRNLGATGLPSVYNDSQGYGYLYQWGRENDYHERTTSSTTTTLSSSDSVGHSSFITMSSSPYDWRSPQNGNLWQGVNGVNNVCPGGFRLPTQSEWSTLISSAGITNRATAYSSSLKLPSAGVRLYSTGALSARGGSGHYWSSSASGMYASYLTFDPANALTTLNFRGNGFSVRCIKN